MKVRAILVVRLVFGRLRMILLVFRERGLKSERCLGISEVPNIENSGHQIEGFEGFIDGKEDFFVVGLYFEDGGLLSDEFGNVVADRALGE